MWNKKISFYTHGIKRHREKTGRDKVFVRICSQSQDGDIIWWLSKRAWKFSIKSGVHLNTLCAQQSDSWVLWQENYPQVPRENPEGGLWVRREMRPPPPTGFVLLCSGKVVPPLGGRSYWEEGTSLGECPWMPYWDLTPLSFTTQIPYTEHIRWLLLPWRNALSCHRSNAMWPRDHRLKALQPWTRINLSSFEVVFSAICHSNWRPMGRRTPWSVTYHARELQTV